MPSTIDHNVLLLVWLTGFILIFLGVPNIKMPQFALGFLIVQALAWLDVIVFTELRLLSFPVREFPRATDTGFSMRFFLFPAIGALFLIREPSSGAFRVKLLYAALFTAIALTIQVASDRYTQLIQAAGAWVYVWSALSFLIVYLLSSFLYTLFWKFQPNASRKDPV